MSGLRGRGAHDSCTGEWFGDLGDEGRTVCAYELGRYFEPFTDKRCFECNLAIRRNLFWPQWSGNRRCTLEEYERMLEEGRVK